MNEAETRNILNRLYTIYPHSFIGWKEQQFTAYVDIWHDCFRNIPFRLVKEAVVENIAKSTSDFAPKPGQIREIIMQRLAPDTELESISAWEDLKRFIRRMTGSTEIDTPSYERLDHIARRIYKYDDLRTISKMDSDQIERRRPEFQRLYKVIRNKENEEFLTEGNIVDLAGGEERFMALGYTETIPNERRIS